MDIYCAGIDIGGTKTSVALFDINMSMLCKKTFRTKDAGSCKMLVRKSVDVCLELCEEQKIEFNSLASIGIASPGPLNAKDGMIINIHNLGFVNEPIIAYFKELTDIPCTLIKDTNAAVYYESILGSGKNYNSVFYITLSTGVGAGICINRQIIEGEYNCSGEIGHMVVKRGGRDCNCGSRGCLEAYASGTAIGRIASEKLGRTVDAKEAFELAANGNQTALEVIAEAGKFVGQAMGNVCQILDPGIIIFGGSVIKDFDIIRPFIEESFDKYTEKFDERKTEIALSDIHGNQTVCGAALYGLHNK